MARELSKKDRAVQRNARKAATAAGKDWKSLPKEERKVFKQRARLEASTDPRFARDKPVKPGVQKAKDAAKAAGQKWRDLSKEQRQAYIARVGGES